MSGVDTRARRGAVPLLAAVLLAAGTGCAAPGDDGTLLDALADVRYEDRPPEGVTYVDVSRANELLAEDRERFAFLASMATPPLTYADTPGHRYGLDPARAHTAVTVGFTGTYGIWHGDFDAAAITGDLAADGFAERETDSGPVWASPDGDLRLTVADDRVAWGHDVFSPAVLTEGDLLSERREYRELADCLGEVYRADFVQKTEEDPVRVYAIGQVADGAGDTGGVICAVTGTEEEAERAAGALRAEIDARPDRYRDAEVSVRGGDLPGVRVTVPDDPQANHAPGRLLLADTELSEALSQL
jgi:hypothetical protein